MTKCPMATKPSSRVLPAMIAGLATAAYYATPDVIASRRGRCWTKAGLMAVTLATSAPDSRLALAEIRRTWRRAGGVEIGAWVAATAGAAGVGAVIENRVFRRGQARAAAGERWPHTRLALVFGSMATGLALLPIPTQVDLPDSDR